MEFRNQFLAALDSAQITGLAPYLTERAMPAGTVLHESGRLVDVVYFPSTAVVSVVMAMTTGRALDAATLGMQSVIGAMPVLSDSLPTSRAVIQIPGDCWRMPAAAFKAQVYRDTALMRLALRHAQQDISQAERDIACNTLHPVQMRLAKCLLLSHDRVGSNLIALTQENLAIMLGVQRTSITSAAKAMMRDGLIRYRRGRIEIIDRARLTRAACECYAAGAHRHSTNDNPQDAPPPPLPGSDQQVRRDGWSAGLGDAGRHRPSIEDRYRHRAKCARLATDHELFGGRTCPESRYPG